tara:strand:+ start:127 stop:462 length:336 start_codon:yes stop_codon:yes gene_type:complete
VLKKLLQKKYLHKLFFDVSSGMGRPRINTPIVAQNKIKDVLQRPNVKRSLLWLSKESGINHTLLYQIVNGDRRLQEHQADKILHTFHKFNVEVSYDDLFTTYHEDTEIYDY